MYLENHYSLKSHFLLLDKTSITRRGLKSFSKIHNIYFKIKLSLKDFKLYSILIFLMLSFLNSSIFKFKNTWILSVTGSHNIFSFLNNFILIWLPLRIHNKVLSSIDSSNFKNLIYSLSGFPFMLELERLIEINEFYFEILRRLKAKLILNVDFLNSNHKESFARILKLPLRLK